MIMNELKCIEILIRHLLTKSNLETEILTEFKDEESFKGIKSNLFNLISIDSLLNNYPQTFFFSLESFLKTGIIPNMYEDRTITPHIESDFKGDYRDFYSCFIKALKDNNYVFDSDNNIHISTELIEATIPEVWLYRLQASAKKGTYERVYFYNKNNISNIPNSKALVEYLRRTKTFIATITTSNPNADYDLDFISARNIVKGKLSHQKEVKVEDVIKLFNENMPPTYEIKSSKYKLSDEYWLVKKADELGKSFYTEPIEIQERLLNKWILERIKSREISLEETQKYLLLSNRNNIYDFNQSKIKTSNVIGGLFILYIKLLNQLSLTPNNIDFQAFKVKRNITPSSQENSIKYSQTGRLINDTNDSLKKVSAKAEDLLKKINALDIIKDFAQITKLQQEYANLLNSYNQYEKEKQDHITNLRLIDKSKEEQPIKESLLPYLLEAADNGRIYINENNLVIEINNNSLSKPTFICTIHINNLLEWLENINYSFEDYSLKVG